MERSGAAFTILRATQFHELAAGLLNGQRRLPVLTIPSGRVQPVDTTDVAARLTQLAAAEPAGRVPDFGGPEVLGTKQLAEQWLAATGRRRRIVQARIPGRLGRGYRDGANLCPQHPDGTVTFAQYLASARH